jgi:hypothetical protein
VGAVRKKGRERQREWGTYVGERREERRGVRAREGGG